MSIIKTLRSHRNVATDERWLSAGAGAALLLLNTWRAEERRSPWLGLLATGLVARGVSGYSLAYQAFGLDSQRVAEGLDQTFLHPTAAHVHTSVVIDRPLAEVYEFCCNTNNLPLILSSVESVDRLPDGFQRLSFHLPQGPRFYSDLELTDDRENSNLISWRTRSRSSWRVQGFLSLKRGRGADDTEAHVSLSYEPPLGLLGNVVARVLSPFADDFVRATLLRLRDILQTKAAVPAAPTAAAPASTPSPVAVDTLITSPQATAAEVGAAADATDIQARVDEDFEKRFRQTLDGHGRLLH